MVKSSVAFVICLINLLFLGHTDQCPDVIFVCLPLHHCMDQRCCPTLIFSPQVSPCLDEKLCGWCGIIFKLSSMESVLPGQWSWLADTVGYAGHVVKEGVALGTKYKFWMKLSMESRSMKIVVQLTSASPWLTSALTSLRKISDMLTIHWKLFKVFPSTAETVKIKKKYLFFGWWYIDMS